MPRTPPGFPSGGGSSGGSSSSGSSSSSSSSSSSGGGGVSSSVSMAYKHVAANYGWDLTSGQIAKLWKERVSVSELQQRFSALQRVKENQTFFNQFEQVLRNQKVIGANQQLTLKEALSFVAGSAPAKWYDIWSRAANRANLAMAGLHVGGTRAQISQDLALSGKQAELIRSKLGQDAVISGAGVKEAHVLAAAFLHDLPESRYQEFGLSKKDFINAVYGGPTQAKTQQAITQLEVNVAARGQEGAQQAVNPNQQSGYTTGSQ